MAWIGILVVLCAGAVFLFSPRYPISLQSDDTASRRELLKHIPLGSTRARAQQAIEESGFECEIIDVVHTQGSASLRCLKSRRFLPLFGWVVLFDLAGDTVVNIRVHYESDPMP